MTADRLPKSILEDVVRGQIDMQFEMLAMRILLSKLRLAVRMSPDQITVDRSVEELKQLIERSANLPSLKRDLEKMCGKVAV